MTDNGWRPIESAPTDVLVRLGGWGHASKYGMLQVGAPELEWHQVIGFAYTQGRFGIRVRTGSRQFTHWMPLPPPPTEDQT